MSQGWKLPTSLFLVIAGAIPYLFMLLQVFVASAGSTSEGHGIGLMWGVLLSAIVACAVSVPAAIWMLLLHHRQQREMSWAYMFPTLFVGVALVAPVFYLSAI